MEREEEEAKAEGIGEMAQWVKVLQHKPGSPSSITGTHEEVEGKNQLHTKLSSDIHTCRPPMMTNKQFYDSSCMHLECQRETDSLLNYKREDRAKDSGVDKEELSTEVLTVHGQPRGQCRH